MLLSLLIKNYALIDSLSIDFSDELTILTGETGAGKSILLGAIGLIIGQRADTSVLRNKSEKCTAEGTFNIRNYNLQDFFAANELDYEDVTTLRREITPQGKSRAFVNDTPVSVKVLHDLGAKLIDIHSQHQNLELNEKHFQLRLVDLVAGTDSLLTEYHTAYHWFVSAKQQLAEMLSLAEQSRKDLDYFEFQFNQLADARLAENEQEELEQELERLTHAEEIKATFTTLYQALNGEDQSVLPVLKDMLNGVGKLRSVFSEAEQLHNRLETLYFELKDISEESLMLGDRTENDPEKAAFISQRLDLIYSLEQKHRVTSVSELLKIQEEFSRKINRISSYDQEIEKLQLQIQEQKNRLEQLASELSKARKAVASPIAKSVIDVLQNLGMANAAFQLNISARPDFSPSGKDDVSFMFSANKNQELQEIARIASGGEMSRLMLAIKTLITDTRALPTIIFDEIDTGISGEIAIKMGVILKKMAQTVQVLNITHLPQIAAKGRHHYKVFKFDENDHTFTSIRKLNEKERLEEIAQMLSGDNYTSTALETARELLQ